MSDRLKRLLFIVGFIILVIAGGFALWFVFFRSFLPGTTITPPNATSTGQLGGALPGSGPATPGSQTTTPGGGVLPTSPSVPGAVIAPGAAAVQTVLLRDGTTNDVSPSSDGSGARYYNPDDSKFYRVTPEGISTTLSEQTFPNVQSVTWGNDSDQAILTFPDNSKVYYNFQTKTQATLPSHWEDFSFSPDDRKVVAKSVALDPGSRYLIVSDPDGSNPKAVEPLGENQDKTFPVWTPNNRIIAYATVGDPVGFDRQQIIMVGQNHENFAALDVEGRGFLPLWSPDGTRVLYSVWDAASDFRPQLWLSGGDPNNMNKDRSKLGIQTWADKCLWADPNTVYCAVPDSLPTGAGLQRDLFTNITDSFYKLNLQTGTQTYLGKPEGVSGGALNPVLTADGNHILFTDAQTGKLYDFQLP
jgi:hypothetical protein